MKRKVRMYKYTCDDCGWVAYRGEIIKAGLCSKCGSTNLPVVTTEDKEFELRDREEIIKTAEYVKRLKEGEDPEKLDKEIWGDDQKDKSLASFTGILTECMVRPRQSPLQQQDEQVY